MKEEFDQLLRDYTGSTEDAQSVWEWVESKLRQSFKRGFDEGVKWQKLENKDEVI